MSSINIIENTPEMMPRLSENDMLTLEHAMNALACQYPMSQEYRELARKVRRINIMRERAHEKEDVQ